MSMPQQKIALLAVSKQDVSTAIIAIYATTQCVQLVVTTLRARVLTVLTTLVALVQLIVLVQELMYGLGMTPSCFAQHVMILAQRVQLAALAITLIVQHVMELLQVKEFRYTAISYTAPITALQVSPITQTPAMARQVPFLEPLSKALAHYGQQVQLLFRHRAHTQRKREVDTSKGQVVQIIWFVVICF